ncbi:MAG: DUF2163 domain-containing protein [Maricaulaceae bacterium]|jgi:uncharacterized phage protein (TIGR02218 family)
MRVIPSSLQGALDSGVTTLCWCWWITRRDDAVFGFTEHDRDLTIGATIYAAASARMAGAVEGQAGFAPGSSAFGGVLDDAGLDEEDLRKGLFDGARVEILRVDWTDPSSSVVVWSGFIGEIRRGETGFEAELRGKSAALGRSIGRVFQRRCDAELGDGRCGFNLSQSGFEAAGTVGTPRSSSAFETGDLAAFADGWFTHGRLMWTSGANEGVTSTVQLHRAGGSSATIELTSPAPFPIAAGDGFAIEAGCDKRWSTCKAKFDNTINFRGFPMIPGDDWLQAGPRSRANNDGGSLWTDRDD